MIGAGMSIRPFVSETGVTHVSTSWFLSDKEDFSNIVKESYKDEVFLNVWDSGITVPKDQIYYIKAIRHLDTDGDGVADEEIQLDPVPIYSKIGDMSIDSRPEVAIDLPYVYVDISMLHDDSSDVFDVSVSEIRCGEEGHESTSWIVTDKNKNVIFTSLNDEDNLRKITFNKEDCDIENNDIIYIGVIQNSNNGGQSMANFEEVLTNPFEYDISSNLRSVSVTIDYELFFEKNGVPYSENTKVIVKDADTNSNIYVGNVIGHIFIIPKEYLNWGQSYTLEIYGNGKKRVVTLTTEIDSDNYLVDNSFKYRNKIRVASNVMNFKTPIIYTDETRNGSLIYDKETAGFKLVSFDFRNNMFVIVDNIESTLSIKESKLNVISLPNNKFLIDAIDLNDVRVFYYVQLDLTRKKLLLLKTINRLDESSTLDNGNNAVTVDRARNIVYYFVLKNDSSSAFRKLNLNTYEIADLENRPDNVHSNSTLIYDGEGELISLNGGVSSLAYRYLIKEEKWKLFMDVPESFRNVPLTTFIRKDKKIMFIRTDDPANSIMMSSIDNPKLIEEQTDGMEGISFDSVMRLKNGRFLLWKSNKKEKVWELG